MNSIESRQLDNSWLRPAIIAQWPEILIVLLIVCGHPLYISTLLASRSEHGIYTGLFLSDSTLLTNLAYASGELALMLSFLHWRGWIPSDFKIKLSGWSSLQGFFLMISAFIGSIVIVFTISQVGHLHSFGSQTAIGHSTNTHIVSPSWVVLIAATIINAYCEEIVYVGYAFNQCVSRSGACFALLLTLLIRMSCHTYQGLIHMLGLGAVFLIFEIYYLFNRNLWPVILAHICFDIFALSYFKLIKDGIL